MATKPTKPTIETKALRAAASSLLPPYPDGSLDIDDTLEKIIKELRLVEIVDQFTTVLDSYEALVDDEYAGTSTFAAKKQEIAKARELLKNLYE